MAVTGSYWQLRLFTLSDPILDIVDKNNIIIYIILLFLQYIILDNLLLDYNKLICFKEQLKNTYDVESFTKEIWRRSF